MKKHLFFPIISFALFGMVLGSSLAVTTYVLTQGEEIKVDGLNLKDSYALGDDIKVNEDVRIVKDNKEYPVDTCILYYPDGTVINSKEFKLGIYGRYKLVLKTGEMNGIITYEKEFIVSRNYYNVGSSASSVTYGELNTKDAYHFKGTNGLWVRLAENDTFTYAEPFNIYNETNNLILYYNSVHMKPEIKNVDIRLTDAYNPNIYIDILNRRGSYEYQNCMAFGANGQRAVGLDQDEQGGITIDGKNYKVAFESLGTLIDANNSTSGAYNPMKLFLDTTSRTNIKLIVEAETIYCKKVISELNNPSIYSYPFEGFTNGNVFLSITASGFEDVSIANIGISHLFGKTEEELDQFMEYKDENAPIFISPVSEDTRQIKGNVPIKVPEIQVYDDTALRGDYDYTVYYNYDSTNPNVVEVVDGTFVPKKLGIYTILYTAYDVYGNLGIYRLDLCATNKGTTGIDFEYSKVVSPIAGKYVKFDQYNALSLNGGFEISVSVIRPDGTIYFGNPEDDFLIDQVGEYTVNYLLKDYFYESTYSYTFTSITDGRPIFEKSYISNSKYYIKGMTYSIEDVRAYKYEGINKANEDLLAYVAFDGGDFQTCNRINVPIVASESVQFKLAAKSDPSIYILSEVSEIVDVSDSSDARRINPYKYFESDTFTQFESDTSGIYIKSASTENGNIDFINKLIFTNFEVTFTIPNEKSMQEFDIVLTDYYNRNNKFVVGFKTISGVSKYVAINDEPSIALEENWKGTQITLKIEGNSLKINKAEFLITNSMTDNYCLFSMESKHVEIGSTIKISKIGNQSFSSETTRDRTIGMMAGKLNEKIYDINSEIVISPLYFADVLSPSSDENAYVSVYLSGSPRVYLLDRNGVEMKNVHDFKSEHIIKFDKYGTYLVIYNYTDGAGQTDEDVGIRQSIKVYDDIAPTMEFVDYDGGVVGVSVNSNITPLAVKVSDNVTPSDRLAIYYVVYNAYATIVATVTKGQTFKVTSSGDYMVYIYCLDEIGNSSYLSYPIHA